MGFGGKNLEDRLSASFLPETDQEKKLLLACELAQTIRKTVYNELGYRISAGISHNKALAKIAGSANKPNAQTVIPVRYIR